MFKRVLNPKPINRQPFKFMLLLKNEKMRYLWITILSLAAFACEKDASELTLATDLPKFTNQTGQLELVLCSRGCYQYLLVVGDQQFFPNDLPSEFKVLTNTQPVVFSGQVQADSTKIFTPGPADEPRFAFAAPNLILTKIARR